MAMFVLGLLLFLAGPLAAIAGNLFHQATGLPAIVGRVGGVVGFVIGILLMVMSTAIYVEDNQGGVVVVKFGTDLPSGSIVATNGEKGPQATVLPPGWHFGYLPLIYALEAVDNVEIPEGKIGIVKAKDGKSLPEGEIYAPAWASAKKMLDAQHFLTDGEGFKGPQVTVLTPGEYRYNPRLYEIETQSVLEVPVGMVAVIKANAGKQYVPSEGEVIEEVNGTPIVPRGYRGIWSEALTPDAYYLHPKAYMVTMVQTTNRMYAYSETGAIVVRTKDGFEFPVDVRVSVKISAENAPYVVARLADPDVIGRDKYTIIENRIILPTIRAIFRNTAETRNALQYVNERSQVENTATEQLRAEFIKSKIETDGVYIADIRISDSEAGRQLLATQTDREVALNQQETFAEKERAQKARSNAVRAEEEANQEVQQAQARSRVLIAQEDAKAEIARAEGQATAYSKKIQALGGVENFVTLEVANKTLEHWKGDLPHVLVAGGQGGGMDALIGTILDEKSSKKK